MNESDRYSQIAPSKTAREVLNALLHPITKYRDDIRSIDTCSHGSQLKHQIVGMCSGSGY